MGTYLQLKNKISKIFFEKRRNDSEIGWVSIPGGEYLMGSPVDDLNRNNDETQHVVTVRPFIISKNIITVQQFKEFIEATGYITDSENGNDEEKGSLIWKGYSSKFKHGASWKCNERGRILSAKDFDHPVIHVSWNDAKAFAEWKGCRLPTEAEWEYACRAGTITRFNTGNELNLNLANYKPDNSSGKYLNIEFRNEILPVGKFKPNAWGLYDMHGNVAEWCNDYYAPYPNEQQINPTGPESGEFRVVRGGSWLSHMRSCRSARRNSCKPDQSMYDVGFRIAFFK
ncbi:MAG: formylglycine-generating enzyme family protein [Mariniphaga sp.]